VPTLIGTFLTPIGGVWSRVSDRRGWANLAPAANPPDSFSGCSREWLFAGNAAASDDAWRLSCM